MLKVAILCDWCGEELDEAGFCLNCEELEQDFMDDHKTYNDMFEAWN